MVLVLTLFSALCDEVLLYLIFTFLVWIFIMLCDTVFHKRIDCIICDHIHPEVQYLPEKRGSVSSGYMLASWMESWDKLTLYRGGRGPCVPYRILPGFCSTIRLEYAHSFDSSTCRCIIYLLQSKCIVRIRLHACVLFMMNKYLSLELCFCLLCAVCMYVPASTAWRSHIFPCLCLKPWTAPDWATSLGHTGNSWQKKEKWSLIAAYNEN